MAEPPLIRAPAAEGRSRERSELPRPKAAPAAAGGYAGCPRGEGEAGGHDRQPPQSSGRSGPGPAPRARKGFDEEERPSEQGEGEASPERIAARDQLQGEKGRSGSSTDESARGEDEATVHEK